MLIREAAELVLRDMNITHDKTQFSWMVLLGVAASVLMTYLNSKDCDLLNNPDEIIKESRKPRPLVRYLAKKKAKKAILGNNPGEEEFETWRTYGKHMVTSTFRVASKRTAEEITSLKTAPDKEDFGLL